MFEVMCGVHCQAWRVLLPGLACVKMSLIRWLCDGRFLSDILS
jgi:hypothetical protein